MATATPVRRQRPGLRTDVPVLVLLVVCVLTVPVGWVHAAAGLALVGAIVFHLGTRSWVRRRRRGGLRLVAERVAYATFLLASAAMVVTGLARWAGVEPRHTFHGGVSWLLLGLVAVHIWAVWRVLRARLRRPAPSMRASGGRAEARRAPAHLQVEEAGRSWDGQPSST